MNVVPWVNTILINHPPRRVYSTPLDIDLVPAHSVINCRPPAHTVLDTESSDIRYYNKSVQYDFSSYIHTFIGN